MRHSILDYLRERKERQFSLLKHLVLQPSHSTYVGGVNAVGEAVIDALSGCDLDVEEIDNEGAGRHILFTSPACKKYNKQILLVGQLDTAYPLDMGFDWYTRENGKVQGPGVIDMKGGLVVTIFALKALHELGLLREYPIAFLCKSGEESAMPSSTALIRAEAIRSFAALIFEYGGLQGEIVTGRKGQATYQIEVRSAENASAILEMAYKIIELEKLNNSQKQLIVNVGTISGGLVSNTVPDLASIRVETQYISQDDYHESRLAIEQIVENCTVADTTGKLRVISHHPPMEKSRANRELYYMVESIAQELGLSVCEEMRSTASDANIIASCGIPVLDGLGPAGDCSHSEREYMVENSLAERTKLVTFAIQRICARFLEDTEQE